MAQQPIQITTSPSDIYEQYMVPAIFGRWSATLLELVAPQRGERVLDLACGTGIVARMAVPMVQPGGKVFGLDFNGAQIATARTMEPSIDWREGDAGNLPYTDQEFDLVVCQQGFMFFPDRVQAVKEIHRVLMPGGRAGIAVWSSIDRAPGYLALIHSLEKRMGSSASHLMDDLTLLADPNEVSRIFAEGGFPDAEVVTLSKEVNFASAEEFTRAIAVGSIMRRTETRFSEELLGQLTLDVATEMEQYIGDNGLVFPMEAHLLTAKK